jgi:ABC-2 type transport system permease protein
VFRRGGQSRRRAIGIAVGAVVAGPWLLTLAFGLGLAAARLGLDVTAFFSAGYTTIAILVMVINLSIVISAFFADRTLLLLALAPVSASQVFISRLLAASAPAWGISTLLLAAVAGYGVGVGASAAYYLAASAGIGLVVVAALSVQVIVLSVVLQVAPVNRARDIANLAAGLLGTGFYVAWFLVSRSGRSGSAQGMTQVASTGTRLLWLPTAWPARSLAAIAAHDPMGAAGWLLATAGCALALCLIAWAGYRRAYLVGVGVYGEGGARIGRRTYRMREATGEGPADPVAALRGKDLLVLRRDMRRLAGVLPSLVMAVVYPFFVTQAGLGGASGNPTFWLTMLGALFGPFLFSNVLALPAVAMEGRGIQLLRLAGVQPWTLLRAKLSYAMPAVVLLGVAGATVVAALAGGGPVRVPLAALASCWFSAGMAAVALGAGAIAPNFEAANPRRAVGFLGGLVSMAGQTLFCACSAGAVVVAAIGAAGIVPPAMLVLSPLLLLAAVAVVAFILAQGVRALRRMQLSSG